MHSVASYCCVLSGAFYLPVPITLSVILQSTIIHYAKEAIYDVLQSLLLVLHRKASKYYYAKSKGQHLKIGNTTR